MLPAEKSPPFSISSRSKNRALKSSVTDPPPSASERLNKARSLLEEYSRDFTPPPQFLLPAELQDFSQDASPVDGTSGSVSAIDAIVVSPPEQDANPIPNAAKVSAEDDGLRTQQKVSSRWENGVKVATPIKTYSPNQNPRYLKRPLIWLKRNLEIALPLARWSSGLIFDLATGKVTEREQVRANELLRAINSLGPAIIKGGQALASRPDLLPKVYLDELQKLQDDVPRFEDHVAFGIVKEELGVDFTELFEIIGDGPVAAASIGQVYKATLKATGETVAIKIQRPDCEETIALDLYILRWWSGIANILTQGILKRDVNVQSIIDDFGELIYREIDYVAEAANAQRFNEIYANLPISIFVPKIYSTLTTSKVLTMEWVDGLRLTDTAALQQYGLDKEELVDSLVQCSLRQILDNGFFHADPHAGNMLATRDGRLCYLDFGMMGYASEEQRNGFLLAVVHMVNRDWNSLVVLYQKLGFIPMSEDATLIEEALEKALPDVLNADVSELNFKNVINKLGDVFYTFPFSLPPFYISIIRCLGVLEGLAIQVDPKFRIISDAYPYIASRLLTDSQPDMQEALKRLALTNEGELRWDRLESLLEEAQSSAGYDVADAIDKLSDYLLRDEADALTQQLSEQVVELVDTLGNDTIEYILNIFRVGISGDERSLVLALRALQTQLATATGAASRSSDSNQQMNDLMPEIPETLQRAGRIIALLTGGIETDEKSIAIYVQKYLPIFRKIANEPKFRKLGTEISAKLVDRLLSRTIRRTLGVNGNGRTTSSAA
ncbi:hypothetical protein TrVE_jg5379 [Triparma verrucosa]|uniref:ABC1 atypical kinase-like domain-containing protein n=1 Tax=Triparma verrucosa TaxID=1606542 RepID=A0A9W7EI39_9STRA|nr:hypothetical protein TrVE_jg5379 [Triparma verrucosa]